MLGGLPGLQRVAGPFGRCPTADCPSEVAALVEGPTDTGSGRARTALAVNPFHRQGRPSRAVHDESGHEQGSAQGNRFAAET